MRKIYSLIVAVLMLVAVTSPVDAFTSRVGEKANVDQEEGLRGLVLMAGSEVVVDGDIDGSLVCAGQNVHITGTVDGDVLCAAQEIKIDGEVVGDVVYASGQELVLGENGRVWGDIRQESKWEMGGMAMGPGMDGEALDSNPFTSAVSSVASVIGFGIKLGMLAIGLIVVALAPKWVARVTKMMEDKVGKSMLWGVAAVFALPIVSALLMISIVGIPLVLVLWITVALTAYLGRILVGIIVGEKILMAAGQKKPKMVWAVVVGMVITWVVFRIPTLGWMLNLGAMLWGLGAIAMSFKMMKR